jgi:hypothetical protein
MDVFERLAVAVRRQNEEGELPDFIVPLLMKVAGNPAGFAGREELVATLPQDSSSISHFPAVTATIPP